VHSGILARSNTPCPAASAPPAPSNAPREIQPDPADFIRNLQTILCIFPEVFAPLQLSAFRMAAFSPSPSVSQFPSPPPSPYHGHLSRETSNRFSFPCYPAQRGCPHIVQGELQFSMPHQSALPRRRTPGFFLTVPPRLSFWSMCRPLSGVVSIRDFFPMFVPNNFGPLLPLQETRTGNHTGFLLFPL